MTLVRMIAIGGLTLAPVQAASQAPPAAPDWAHAEIVTVRLSSFHFAPATIRLKAGRIYDLHLENQSSGGHDFAARQFFTAARIMDADLGKVVRGKVSIDGATSIDVRVVAPPAGTYKLRCTHFMHGAFGMTGEIVVQ